jgi:hypothetical protein
VESLALDELSPTHAPSGRQHLTIDERLEALTHTVELLAGMQIETEKKMQALAEAQTKTAEAAASSEKTIKKLGRFAMIIALDHESRIGALESIGDEL